MSFATLTWFLHKSDPAVSLQDSSLVALFQMMRLLPNESCVTIGVRAGPNLHQLFRPECGDKLVLMDEHNDKSEKRHSPVCAREYLWVHTMGDLQRCPNGMRCELQEDMQIQGPTAMH